MSVVTRTPQEQRTRAMRVPTIASTVWASSILQRVQNESTSPPTRGTDIALLQGRGAHV